MKWSKPNGIELENVSDERGNVRRCFKLGWTPEDPELAQAIAFPKSTRPIVAAIDQDITRAIDQAQVMTDSDLSDASTAQPGTVGENENIPDSDVLATAKALTPGTGDEGHGAPGSMLWHEIQLNNLDRKKNISDYVSTITGEGIPQAGTLEDMRRIALDSLEAFKKLEAETA